LNKKLKEAEWIRMHTLNKDQFNKLIQEKLKRAAEQRAALHRQEILIQKYRWLQSVKDSSNASWA